MLSHRQWVVALVAVVVLGAMAAVLRSNGIDRAQRSVSTGGITTILVVPFTIIGSGGEASSGGQLSEQVRMALSKDTSLETRRSEMQPANAQLAAARRAAAYYVLRGTVDQKPRGVEIGLRLVRASDASTAWSGTFWKSAADLPSSAGDLASAVSEAIRAEHDSEARRHDRQSSRTQQPH
jgi:TolB-like protein